MMSHEDARDSSGVGGSNAVWELASFLKKQLAQKRCQEGGGVPFFKMPGGFLALRRPDGLVGFGPGFA